MGPEPSRVLLASPAPRRATLTVKPPGDDVHVAPAVQPPQGDVQVAPAMQPPEGQVLAAGGVTVVARPRVPSLAGDSTTADSQHVVIDLTDTVTTAVSPVAGTRQERRSRIWVVLTVIALVATVLAIANFVIGMQWRSQALAARDRAERAAADVAAKQDAVIDARAASATSDLRRETMAQQLAVSEADVAALEARIATLASDKAHAEDNGDYAAEVPSDAQLESLRTQLDSCVAQVAALRTGLQAGNGSSTALDAARAAQASCEQAGADLAALAAKQ